MKKDLKFKGFKYIIEKSADILKMYNDSKILKISSLSAVAFLLGLGVTSSVLSAKVRISERHAVGGFETSKGPEFTEKLEPLFDSIQEENASVEAALSSAFVSSSEKEKSDDSVITYQTYRVKAGDMIGFIADEFGVTQDTLISVNNIRQTRLIQVGQYLKIPSMPGIIYTVKSSGETPTTIAAKYDVDADKCALVNSMAVDTTLSAGSSLFIPNAELDWVTRQEINGDLFHKPLHNRYWLSSYYGWRNSPFDASRRTFHGGVDMASPAGTPIYAALDGRVTATGYNATYGNYVIIQHHSGYKTLYAHMSSIACRQGNFVYTNTVIGRVGSTGLSTGPHLHFTVYKNGKTMNPLSLLN